MLVTMTTMTKAGPPAQPHPSLQNRQPVNTPRPELLWVLSRLLLYRFPSCLGRAAPATGVCCPRRLSSGVTSHRRPCWTPPPCRVPLLRSQGPAEAGGSQGPQHPPGSPGAASASFASVPRAQHLAGLRGQLGVTGQTDEGPLLTPLWSCRLSSQESELGNQ